MGQACCSNGASPFGRQLYEATKAEANAELRKVAVTELLNTPNRVIAVAAARLYVSVERFKAAVGFYPEESTKDFRLRFDEQHPLPETTKA